MGKSKNVILITIDDLRADHLSCYGYGIETSPNIDKLAEKGLLFSQAIANGPSTRYCFTPIFASTYPLAYGLDIHLPKQAVPISEILKQQGYQTAAFNAGIPWISRYYGYDRGFDDFFDFIEKRSAVSRISYFITHRLYKLVMKRHLLSSCLSKVYWAAQDFANYFQFFIRHKYPYQPADILNQKVISWLANAKGNFFLWIHYLDVHELYVCSGEFHPREIGRRQILKAWKAQRNNKHSSEEVLDTIIRLYDSQIRYVDYHLGLLLDKLRESGMFDDTFIVLTSDHGEGFGEHGELSHPNELYDELLRIPLIIVGPATLRKVITDEVSQIDIAPTILELLDIGETEKFQGKSLISLMYGQRHTSYIISECLIPKTTKKKIAYRTEEWKAIFSEDDHYELYNLKEDPKEVKNVAKFHQEMADKFKAKILSHLEWEENLRKSSADRDRLRALIKEVKKLGKI
jgi:arylsulfatase A-like enzyme